MLLVPSTQENRIFRTATSDSLSNSVLKDTHLSPAMRDPLDKVFLKLLSSKITGKGLCNDELILSILK